MKCIPARAKKFKLICQPRQIMHPGAAPGFGECIICASLARVPDINR